MSIRAGTNPWAIELASDEHFIYAARRHWAWLLYRCSVALVLALLAAGLAIFRSLGGRLFALDVALERELDVPNILLLGGAFILGAGWLIARRRAPKERFVQGALVAGAAVLLALFLFRYTGGRVFYISPLGSPGLDLLNRVLIGFVLFMFAVCAYMGLDWTDDALVLTNRRIVHDHRVLLQRHVQEQVALENIQNVQSFKRTYPAYWFNYGTLVVQAASVGRRLTFPMARDPDAMQKLAVAELNRTRGAASEDQYRTMVEKQVYKAQVLKPKLPVSLRTRHVPKLLNWVLYDNPEIDDEQATIVWRPHWLRTLLETSPALVSLVAGILLLIFSIRASLLVGALAVVVGTLIFLGCSFWAIWRYLDSREDELILTPNMVVDREKKPFGPETRRTATLSAVQNVQYKTTLLGTILGYGEISIQTAGSSANLSFEYLPNPQEAARTIYDYIREYQKGERERSLSDALLLLQFFHEAQVQRGEFDDS
jgi:hypothetical protein